MSTAAVNSATSYTDVQFHHQQQQQQHQRYVMMTSDAPQHRVTSSHDVIDSSQSHVTADVNNNKQLEVYSRHLNSVCAPSRHAHVFSRRYVLVHGQLTIIFVVSVCLFVQSFSQPSLIRFRSN